MREDSLRHQLSCVKVRQGCVFARCQPQPNVEPGNMAYKVLREIGGAEVIGSVLMAMRKPEPILQFGASGRNILNMTTIAVADAQRDGEAL